MPEGDPRDIPARAHDRFARVIVDLDPAHLDRPFDYRIPDGVDVLPGQRVKVRFAGRTRAGWVVGTAAETEIAPERVQPLQPWGDVAWFDDRDLRLFRWVARRYAAPLAHVLRHALPKRVAGVEKDMSGWGPAPDAGAARLTSGDSEDARAAWRHYDAGPLLDAVAGNGAAPAPAFWWRSLPGDDADDMIVGLVHATLAAGRGAVVVAPDPRAPLLAAVQSAFAGLVGDHRSARADRTRYRAFLRGRTGHARVAIGERSGVFAPVPHVGLIVVDDEASGVYKEQRSPRHHVREVALTRARFDGAVCILRSDLPSASLWRLLEGGHVRRLIPDRGVERARRPRVDVVDLSSPEPGVRRARFSPRANRGLGEVVANGGRAVVLAARGGLGAALACTRCGQRRECPVCAGSLRPVAARGPEEGRGPAGGGPGERRGRHSGLSSPAPVLAETPDAWECPGCAWQGRSFPCLQCSASRTAPLAAGAGRLAAELARGHPAAQVVRMEGFDAPGPDRSPAIAVMTRGSVVDEPGWLDGQQARLVVAPDADGMLLRPSIDAAEDTLRLWFAAARLAGRMIVQTREPDHHAVQALVRWDPEGYWAVEAPRRAQLGFPPATWLVRITADPDQAVQVTQELRAVLPDDDVLLGPTPTGTWLIKSSRLWDTIPAVYQLRRTWDRAARGVRVDVDPAEGH